MWILLQKNMNGGVLTVGIYGIHQFDHLNTVRIWSTLIFASLLIDSDFIHYSWDSTHTKKQLNDHFFPILSYTHCKMRSNIKNKKRYWLEFNTRSLGSMEWTRTWSCHLVQHNGLRNWNCKTLSIKFWNRVKIFLMI